MAEGGDLSDEIRGLDDYRLKSKADAEAVCDLLENFSSQKLTEENGSALHALIGLFQDVEDRDCPACEVMAETGIPLLAKIVNSALQEDQGEDEHPDHEDLILFALKMMAMYGTSEGTDGVISAARKPLNPDGYMWSVILGQYTKGHPQAEQLFESLRNPLPTGFLAMSLLDAANAAKIDGADFPHPFDSPGGQKQLENWLTDPDEEHFSYAISTVASLPFISSPERDALLAIAFDHPSADVQVEAAWASAKLGGEAGIKWLARSCCDVNLSDKAKRYLQELGRDDAIPAEANDPDFQAKAEFAQWLAHPNELGRSPDELEIVDHRELAWPPDRQVKPFWLIRYVLRDKTGLEKDDVDCGLVGSMTWCFFSRNMNQRPPEDAYAIHSYWEMQHIEVVSETEVPDSSEYEALLGQWRGEPLESAIITHVCETTLPLEKPGRVTAVASAKRNGQEGWVVLDGDRSAWYPKDEQPEETSNQVVLSLHVGRRLLRFVNQPDRKKYLQSPQPRQNASVFVAAYEKRIAEIPTLPPDSQAKQLESWEMLSQKFEAYVDALVEGRGIEKPSAVIDAYDRFLQLAKQTDKSIRKKAYGTHTVLGEHFEKQVEALLHCGRNEEVLALIEIFQPHWKNNLGYGRFGTAAFNAGRKDIAEPHLLKLKEGLNEQCGSKEMALLADIWNDQGKSSDARNLLVEWMRINLKKIAKAKYACDKEIHAIDYRLHYATYLRLFPDSASELAEQGIPENPL